MPSPKLLAGAVSSSASPTAGKTRITTEDFGTLLTLMLLTDRSALTSVPSLTAHRSYRLSSGENRESLLKFRKTIASGLIAR
jgi:hypothetical protein